MGRVVWGPPCAQFRILEKLSSETARTSWRCRMLRRPGLNRCGGSRAGRRRDHDRARALLLRGCDAACLLWAGLLPWQRCVHCRNAPVRHLGGGRVPGRAHLRPQRRRDVRVVEPGQPGRLRLCRRLGAKSDRNQLRSSLLSLLPSALLRALLVLRVSAAAPSDAFGDPWLMSLSLSRRSTCTCGTRSAATS